MPAQLYNVTVIIAVGDGCVETHEFENAAFEMVADDSLCMKIGEKYTVIPWHSIVWYEYENVEAE